MSDQKLPGLDGLRAFAVLLVVLFHRYLLDIGWLGVQIFFVLSGYLITRLLDRARGQPLGEYLRNFYGRRALRIFPLYYAAITLLALATWRGAKLEGVREGLPFAASYTYNFWYATRAHGFSMLLTHFWTLCVEEQFYLLWPFVIYFCPRRHMKATLLSVIAMGPLLRVLGAWFLSRPGASQLLDWTVALDVLTPSQLDAFASGAFVALFPERSSVRVAGFAFGLWLALGLALSLVFGLAWSTFGYPIGMAPGYAFIWGYSLINGFSALLIDGLAHERFLPKLFAARPLSYLGRISYGLYVIHYPMQQVTDRLLPHAALAVRVVLQVGLTIALASASFHFWESRFLSLKDRWFKARMRARPELTA